LTKSFYCCIDSALPATQPEQHLICEKIANLNSGKIVFYGAEDVLVKKNQPFIYEKLKRTPNIDGVIFFTIDQFCYNKSINVSLIQKLLKMPLSIHFARENISYFDFKQVRKDLPEIYSYFYSLNRNRKQYALQIKSF
jgi:hypothetical protein